MYPETLYSIIYLNTFKNKVFIKQRNMKAFLQPFSAIGRSAVGLFSKIFYCFSKSGYCFTTCKCEGSLGIRRPCRVTRTCNFLSSYLVLTPVGSKGYGIAFSPKKRAPPHTHKQDNNFRDDFAFLPLLFPIASLN